MRSAETPAPAKEHSDERWYHCANCGGILFRSTVPLGTPNGIDIKCRDRRCRWTTFVLIGRAEDHVVDHAAWLERWQARQAARAS